MSTQTATTTTEPDLKPALVAFAKKTHRPAETITDELKAARERFKLLEPQNRDYAARVVRAEARRKMLEEKNRRENPDNPFDPEAYTPPAYLLPRDADITRQFHAVHYLIDRLDRELEAAKTAAAGL